MKDFDWTQMTQEAKDLHGYQLLNRPKFHGVKRLFESMATFHMVRGMGKRAELFALVDVFQAGVREGQRMERARRRGEGGSIEAAREAKKENAAKRAVEKRTWIDGQTLPVSIADMAEQFDVHPKTIRRWVEKQDDLTCDDGKVHKKES